MRNFDILSPFSYVKSWFGALKICDAGKDYQRLYAAVKSKNRKNFRERRGGVRLSSRIPSAEMSFSISHKFTDIRLTQDILRLQLFDFKMLLNVGLANIGTIFSNMRKAVGCVSAYT